VSEYFTERDRKGAHLHGRWAQTGQLLLHPVSDTGVHGCTTRKDNVAIEISTDIKIALVDRVVRRLMDTRSFKTEEGRLKECFRGAEASRKKGLEKGPSEKSRNAYRSFPMVIT
jgi:hypothetical protein